MKKTIAIDFDGIISKYDGFKGLTVYGKPIMENVDYIKELYMNGYNLVLFTTRLNPELNNSRDNKISYYSLKHYLEDININKCFTFLTGCKPLADLYLDDRAVNNIHDLELIIKKLK